MSESTCVVITGATSAIAKALARQLASNGERVLLAGRDAEETERNAADCRVAYGADVHAAGPYDASDGASAKRLLSEAQVRFGGVRGVIAVHGLMHPQGDAWDDPSKGSAMFKVNAASVHELAAVFCPELTGDRRFFCCVSSVAGDRGLSWKIRSRHAGRSSNFIYGSTKAAVNAYLDGLRAAVADEGISVTTVKPGFVDTAMTWGLDGMFLVASPDSVAGDILRAVEKGKAVVYTPRFWWGIMTIIRSIPRGLFDRMKM